MGVGGQHHAPAALHPGKTRYPLYRRLGRPQGRSGRVRKISPPTGIDPRTVKPVASRYTDWAISVPILEQGIERNIQGKIEVTWRRGSRCKQLLNNHKETRGYWVLKKETLDRTQWRTSLGKGYGPVAKQTGRWINEWYSFSKDEVLLQKSSTR